eukprot:TRINITY_DN8674_c0_g1_i1.p2 TRINITY_DN8674_c0_g1~~TRINITY_DN8674_c0_g1_i1.p2  ORF type:complete len:71 (-),score=8.02 TRINITY_DN8674_c0_g1_i1:134-346(-)
MMTLYMKIHIFAKVTMEVPLREVVGNVFKAKIFLRRVTRRGALLATMGYGSALRRVVDVLIVSLRLLLSV